MSPAIAAAASILLGYLAGSIPFGFLAVRLQSGVDIRTVGSGNIGATNVGRALGRPWAIAVYLFDAAKGFAAVLLFPPFVAPSGGEPVAVWTGVAAVLGHCFPLFLGFRGGKGIATVSGVLLALEPIAFAAGAAVWIGILAACRFASVASIGMALTYPAVVVALDPAAALRGRASLLAGSVSLAFLVIVRHRENLRRLARGREPRVGRG